MHRLSSGQLRGELDNSGRAPPGTLPHGSPCGVATATITMRVRGWDWT